MAYKLNKFATLCQEDDVVDIDINMEPTEGEEAEAVEAEIEANEDAAEIEDAMDQADNAETAADEVEEKIEEGEAVIAVSEPAVDNGGEVPTGIVVTTDSGKELTDEEVAEAAEKLNEAGEVAPEVVVEQEMFIQRIELITGLKRRNPGISLESARRNSTDNYKLCQEGLKEMGARIAEFIKSVINWIKTKVKKIIETISKYLPTKVGKLKRFLDKVEASTMSTFDLPENAARNIAYFKLFNIMPDGTAYLDSGSSILAAADKQIKNRGFGNEYTLELKSFSIDENNEVTIEGYIVAKTIVSRTLSDLANSDIDSLESVTVKEKLTIDKAITKSSLIKFIKDIIPVVSATTKMTEKVAKIIAPLLDKILGKIEARQETKAMKATKLKTTLLRTKLAYSVKWSSFISSALLNSIMTIPLTAENKATKEAAEAEPKAE